MSSIAGTVRNGIIIGNNRFAIVVGSRDERAVKNGAIRKHRRIYSGRLEVIVPIARVVRNGIIAFNNHVAFVVGSPY